jgi:hypothetical protein
MDSLVTTTDEYVMVNHITQYRDSRPQRQEIQAVNWVQVIHFANWFWMLQGLTLELAGVFVDVPLNTEARKFYDMLEVVDTPI